MIFDQNRGSERSWTNIDPVGVTILLPSEDFVLLNHSTFKPFECYSDRLLARKGRQSLRTGQQTNPVLVLTKAELLGHGGPEEIAKRLPEKFRPHLRNMFYRGDLQEICDFSLQVHLGMESIHDWWTQKAEKKRRR